MDLHSFVIYTNHWNDHHLFLAHLLGCSDPTGDEKKISEAAADDPGQNDNPREKLNMPVAKG